MVLVKSFVDTRLYRGACYQAAGWQALGRTAGWVRAGEDYYQTRAPERSLGGPLHRQASNWLRSKILPATIARGERVPRHTTAYRFRSYARTGTLKTRCTTAATANTTKTVIKSGDAACS